MRSFYGDRVVGYTEKSRCLMFLHFPFCQRESLDQQMELLILSALFSVCHIMIILHKDTKFDIDILHKIRTLQVMFSHQFQGIFYVLDQGYKECIGAYCARELSGGNNEIFCEFKTGIAESMGQYVSWLLPTTFVLSIPIGSLISY